LLSDSFKEKQESLSCGIKLSLEDAGVQRHFSFRCQAARPSATANTNSARNIAQAWHGMSSMAATSNALPAIIVMAGKEAITMS
jgi:hypothetical protein